MSGEFRRHAIIAQNRKRKRFTLDKRGNVIDTLDGGALYFIGEIGFSRAQMRVIADLHNERPNATWDQIESEWEKRCARL